MWFYFYRRLSPDQNGPFPLYSARRLNDQTQRALAKAPAHYPADAYAWDHRADTYTYLTEIKRFLFNVFVPGIDVRRIRTRPIPTQPGTRNETPASTLAVGSANLKQCNSLMTKSPACPRMNGLH
jgi:hypothetical protein